MNSKNLKEKKDALGQILWAHLNGKRSYEIIERDDGFVDVTPGADNYFAEFKDWPKQQKEGVKFVKGKVLDVGAGAGRVSLYLQQKGLKVTAIDNSPLAVKVCKKRGVKDVMILPLEEISFFKKGSFSSVLMYGNNFGLLESYKKAKNILKKLYSITEEEGTIVAECRDPYKTNDDVHLDYHKLNKKRGRYPGALRIRVRFKDYKSDWFSFLFVSQKEMEDILKGTGWVVKKIIKGDGGSYVAIIEKEKLKK